MNDRIHFRDGLGNRLRVAQIAVNQGNAKFLQQSGIAVRPHDGADLPAALDKRLRQMAANEACRTGDQKTRGHGEFSSEW